MKDDMTARKGYKKGGTVKKAGKPGAGPKAGAGGAQGRLNKTAKVK